jgi:hypothetical protein
VVGGGDRQVCQRLRKSCFGERRLTTGRKSAAHGNMVVKDSH